MMARCSEPFVGRLPLSLTRPSNFGLEPSVTRGHAACREAQALRHAARGSTRIVIRSEGVETLAREGPNAIGPGYSLGTGGPCWTIRAVVSCGGFVSVWMGARRTDLPTVAVCGAVPNIGVCRIRHGSQAKWSRDLRRNGRCQRSNLRASRGAVPCTLSLATSSSSRRSFCCICGNLAQHGLGRLVATVS